MKYESINFDNKFSKFADHWSPRVIAEMNDYQFKLVKIKDEVTQHDHKDTDEVFVVLSGKMEIAFRDGKGTTQIRAEIHAKEILKLGSEQNLDKKQR